MKLIKKKRILQIAEEAGLVYNTHLERFKIFPHHAKALYDFYMLIEEEKEKNAERENQG